MNCLVTLYVKLNESRSLIPKICAQFLWGLETRNNDDVDDVVFC